ncbi:hypothetical protein AGMMS49983_13750 [Clostridia bacterium]|nr:hypothetical protein AGMMS49983_13750 [Clostridia bacterium]
MATKYTTSFENALISWEQIADKFIASLKSNIKALSKINFDYEKVIVRVCAKELDGRKKRCGQGPLYSSQVSISKEDAETVWELFDEFVAKQGLSPAERLSNNEEGLRRYDFQSISIETGDRLICRLFLPSEWNGEGHINLRVFIGPRFRTIDLVGLGKL